MRLYAALFIVFCLLFPAGPVAMFAQGESAVPFLLITSAIDGNGMGGISASYPSENAFSTIANPGQLGFFTLQNVLSVSTYTPKAAWLPQFNIPNLTYDVTAISAGINLQQFVSLPVPVSVGFGYSKISLELGSFTIFSPLGGIMTSTSNESSENFTIGVGVDYYVRAGFGFTTKSIVSNLSPIGTESELATGRAKVSAYDFGMLLQAPIIDIVAKAKGEPVEFAPGLSPLADLSFGYVRSNIGGEVSYLAAAQSDPLPRRAAIGLDLELGVMSKKVADGWKIASFTWARESEDVLVTRKSDGSFDYQSGLGDINFVDNVILGKWGSKVTLRKGWQVQAAECIYVRQGSVIMPGLKYTTRGYGIALGGFFKLVEAIAPSTNSGGMVQFIADHFDVQFQTCTYSETESPIAGTSMSQLTFVIRKLPF
jgi:hypothetical protein